MKILIADTSPLISLIVINQLSVLFDLYNEVYLPEAVWIELNSHNEIVSYVSDLKRLEGRVRQVKLQSEFPEIDKGENEAIVLYKEMKAHLLLIDDKLGREIAEANEVSCIGTLALLIQAKRKSKISSLREIFIALLQKKRYYSKEVLNQILLLEKEELL